MPVMTGNEAVHQIRETRPDVQVICVTGSSNDLLLKDVPVLETFQAESASQFC
jgi:CheY-like chemotaxis protein